MISARKNNIQAGLLVKIPEFLKFRLQSPEREPARMLYAAAAAQGRSPALFSDLGAPDTVEGRFEMVSTHVYLILRRLRSFQTPPTRKLAQAVLDVFMEDLDDSLRELGVGDMSIARKIRKMAENFYGRIGAFEDALKPDADANALASAIALNVFETSDGTKGEALATYMRRAESVIAEQTQADLLAGIVTFAPITLDNAQ